jgi:hypothetical protein
MIFMKKIHLGIILCLVLLLSMAIPIHGESKTIDYGDSTESISSNGDIYFFAFAFIEGDYENCWKHFTFFKLWNSNFTNTINVLGYLDLERGFISVKAFEVVGSHRIGFIGQHHCCIFAWSWSGVTVSTH